MRTSAVSVWEVESLVRAKIAAEKAVEINVKGRTPVEAVGLAGIKVGKVQALEEVLAGIEDLREGRF